MRIRFSAVIMLFVIMSGCENSQVAVSVPPASPIKEIHSRVEYIDNERRPVPFENRPKDIKLIFPYIPGQIFGAPTSKPLFIKHLPDNLAFDLDLESTEREIDADAQPLGNNENTSGLTITPQAARLVRIATYAQDGETSKVIGAGGFMDSASRDHLILLYVDRACSITGTLNAGSEVFEHDIQLDGAGFHWIRLHPQGQGRYLLRRHPASDAVFFSIRLPDAEGS